MSAFLALLKARNTEFYRDTGGMAWAFVFPLMIIIGCALAFSTPDTSVFKVGVIGEQASYEQALPLLKQDYINVVKFEQTEKALKRIKYHQLDLLISNNQYWMNTESSPSIAAETLLFPKGSDFTRQILAGQAVRYVDWVMPGVLGMNLMFASLFGVGFVIVRYRRNGVLKRLQATPVTALQFLSAQMMSRLFIVVSVNAIIFIGCNFFLDLIVLGSYFNLLIIAILGGLSLGSVGLLIASRTANEELGGGLLNVASWPMLFLSELWFSLDESPQWMQNAAELLPLTHVVKATRAVMIDGATLAEVSYHLIWLASLTVVFIAIAASLFRWHEGD
jgi:ABC-type multidrug transport system permease subunit